MNHATALSRSIEAIAPFRHSREHREAIPATVRGTVPAWLRGELLRTCPVIFETAGWRAEHWFDGLGMIYGFRIDGSSVDFRSRLLDSETAREARQGKADLAAFGTPTTRPLWRRLLAPIPRAGDNTNVNIVKLGADLVALTESDTQMRIDRETLAAAGPVEYTPDDLGRAIPIAHPHFDAGRDLVVSAALQFGRTATVSIYQHAPAARTREVVGTWRTDRMPYLHSFGLTPRHVALVAHPFTVSPLEMLFSNKGYIDHFGWDAQEGTRLVVMDRATGAVREHVAAALFAFHTVNAFERGDETVVDLLAYPDAGIVSALRVDRMVAQLPDLRPSLVRLVMRPGQERASLEARSDVGFEFPATNYRAVNGQPYRYAWGASNGPLADGRYASAVVKVDLSSGASASFSDGDSIFGEPLFVARPQGDGEDDGVLLSVGSSTRSETSVLAIIDAKSMGLLATADVPGWIPLGFHGSFMRTGDPS